MDCLPRCYIIFNRYRKQKQTIQHNMQMVPDKLACFGLIHLARVLASYVQIYIHTMVQMSIVAMVEMLMLGMTCTLKPVPVRLLSMHGP